MAIDETERDWLRLLHTCDMMENIIGGLKMEDDTDTERKKHVGNLVMLLETEVLDTKWTEAKKDLTRLNDTIKTGRTYWKS